jgi:hypothetical protein
MPKLTRNNSVTVELTAGQRIDVSSGGIVSQVGGGLAYDFRLWPATLGAFTVPVVLEIKAVESDVDYEVLQVQEYAAATIDFPDEIAELPAVGRTGAIYLTTEGPVYWYQATGQYLALDAAPSVPVNDSAPVISGEGEVGATLTCDPGVWDFRPTEFAFQWEVDGAEVEGATGQTFVVPAEAAELDVTCIVTASNVVGDSDPETSNAISIAAED